MSDPIRRLDLGAVSPLRSQAVYHGLAAALDAGAPDTIVFCRPAAPYFCVGFHQEPAAELRARWCRTHGYPVLHRKIGGGTVLLDGNQLFYQCVFHRSRAPFDVASIYRRFLSPVVEALRRLGVRAELAQVNEIEAGGRRVAGTGGGQLDEAVVVVGNVLFDFPCALMAEAWRVPSAPFRRLAEDGLRRYLTTLRRELGDPPAVEHVTETLAACYAEALGRPLVRGGLSRAEDAAIERAEAELGDGTGRRPPSRRARRLKIARGTFVWEDRRDTTSGPLWLTVRTRAETLDAVVARPARWRPLARALEGRRLERASLLAAVGGTPAGRELVETLLTVTSPSRPSRHG